MIDFIKDRARLIIVFVLILLFIIAVISQKNTNTSSTADYKQIDNTSKMIKGDPNAPVSIIQYSDFICPSCSLFSTEVMPTIEKDYIDTGKVKFEFRPMAFIADGSTQSGMGAYCAIDQEKFWQYHDAIYKFVVDKVFNDGLDPKTDVILTNNLVKSIAKDTGLDSESFDDCLDTKKHSSSISESTRAANKNGINSTPYILVNGEKYQGNIDLNSFEALIKTEL